MLPWLFAQKGKYNKMCCPLEPIRPSPTQVCTVYVDRIPPFAISILCSYAVLCLCVCELAPPTAFGNNLSNSRRHLQTEYRNKCEFLISVGADGQDKTIGFRLGKYKGGSCAVVGPSETSHVSAEAKRVVAEFQKFIRYT